MRKLSTSAEIKQQNCNRKCDIIQQLRSTLTLV